MKVTTIGMDLAKNVIQVHGVDAHGKTVLKKPLKRGQVAAFFGTLAPCLVGMEACGSAHHWARTLQARGHTVKLMAPQFVKPYVKSHKTDAADAEAICEAVARPTMRFVPIKTVERQAILAVHRARQGFVKARTAQANQIRGLLAEYGIVIPQGITHIPRRLPEILEDGANDLPPVFRALLVRLSDHLKALDQQAQAGAGGTDSGLAPAERRQPPAGADPRDWPHYSERPRGLGGRVCPVSVSIYQTRMLRQNTIMIHRYIQGLGISDRAPRS